MVLRIIVRHYFRLDLFSNFSSFWMLYFRFLNRLFLLLSRLLWHILLRRGELRFEHGSFLPKSAGVPRGNFGSTLLLALLRLMISLHLVSFWQLLDLLLNVFFLQVTTNFHVILILYLNVLVDLWQEICNEATISSLDLPHYFLLLL